MNAARLFRCSFILAAALGAAAHAAPAKDPLRAALEDAPRVVVVTLLPEPQISAVAGSGPIQFATVRYRYEVQPPAGQPYSAQMTGAYALGNAIGNAMVDQLMIDSMLNSQRVYEAAKLQAISLQFKERSVAATYTDEFAAAFEAEYGRKVDRRVIKPKMSKEERIALLKSEVRALVLFLEPQIALTPDKRALRLTTTIDATVSNGSRGKSLRKAAIEATMGSVAERGEGAAIARYAADGAALFRERLHQAVQESMHVLTLPPLDVAAKPREYEVNTGNAYFSMTGRELERGADHVTVDSGDGEVLSIVHFETLVER